MNSLVDSPALMTEQMKRYYTIFKLHSAIKTDASLLVQYISNSLSVSSVIMQTLNITLTSSIIFAQT
jgi:hypothetical protein